MADTSNIDEVMVGLDAFLDSFNFARPGVESSLGKDIAMAIIRGPDVGAMGGIMGRCADEVTPDGTPWPDNSSEYDEDKERRYGWREKNRRTGQMLSQEALYGRTRIEPDRIEMVYGNDKAPDKSVSPTGYISKGDKAITDVEKATLRTAAGAGFYGFNDDDRRNVIAVAQENLNDHIKDWNQGNG